ncbi:MAG: hypothetical protein LBL35_08590 [Clostridiales bacterium]|jgi:hypothetical protein|nr:hypothetical protein [Clostridiales bacterium]
MKKSMALLLVAVMALSAATFSGCSFIKNLFTPIDQIGRNSDKSDSGKTDKPSSNNDDKDNDATPVEQPDDGEIEFF